MSDTGWKSPGTVVDDDSVGTVAWTNPDNAKASDNNYVTADLESGTNKDKSVKIVIGGSIVGSDKGTLTAVSTSDSYQLFGGVSDKWGSSISSTQVNSSDFGVVFQASNYGDTIGSHYLKATNFGFSIPTNAVINGIEVGVEWHNTIFTGIANVDHIQIKVYYTEGTAVNSERSSKIKGHSTSNSERSSRISGSQTLSTDYFNIVFSKEANSERSAKLKGSDSGSDTRGAKITGCLLTNDSRNAKIYGQVGAFDTRAVKIHGLATISDTKSVKIRGKLDTFDTRLSKIHGSSIGTDGRNTKIHGYSTTNDLRAAKIRGGIISTSEKSAVIHGSLSVVDNRNAKIHGFESISNERSAKIHGLTNAFDIRQAKIRGGLFVSDIRNAKISGIMIASNERGARIGGSWTLYSEDIPVSLQGVDKPVVGTDNGTLVMSSSNDMPSGFILDDDETIYYNDDRPSL